MRERKYYVYISTNKNNEVLYVGISNSMIRRSWEHKSKVYDNSFTEKYNINKMVYYEIWGDVKQAIFREKQIKNLLRKKKIDLINKVNPSWVDVTDVIE